MKTLLLTFLSLLAVCMSAIAQDSIRTIQGKVMIVKIKRVTPYQVNYLPYRPDSRYSSNDNNYRKISVSKVAEVIYADGRRDSILPVIARSVDTGKGLTSSQYFYALGVNDARLYYRGYKPAATATFLTTFPGSPILGLAVAGVTSTRKPSPYRFTYPNPDLLQSEDYKQGYAKKAGRLKVEKVWTNWAVGTLITAVVVALVTGINL